MGEVEMRTIVRGSTCRCMCICFLELHILLTLAPVPLYIRKISNEDASCEMLMSKNRIAPIGNRGKDTLPLLKLASTSLLCAPRLQNYNKKLKDKITLVYPYCFYFGGYSS